MRGALVALVRTEPVSVLEDYQRLMDLVGCWSLSAPVAQVVVADVTRHFPFPAANTAPWQFEGVVRALRRAGCDDVAWVRVGMPLGHGVVDDLNGYVPIADSYALLPGLPIAAHAVHSLGGSPRLGGVAGAQVVYLPTLGHHDGVSFAGAMASAYRAMGGGMSVGGGGLTPLALVEALALQQERRMVACAVMDATTVHQRGQRVPAVRNVLLASCDLVALDAVAARLLGYEPLRDLSALRLAHERGLGVGDLRAVTLVGDVALLDECWGGLLPVHPLRGGRAFGRVCHQRWRAWGARFLPVAVRRRWAFYRWSNQDRCLFESWLRDTGWGRLFRAYQRHWRRDIVCGGE